MKLRDILLKLIWCCFVMLSCETQEEGIEGIRRIETTETEFLQFDEQQTFQEIILNNSLENFWKITSFSFDQENLTQDFANTRFVFENEGQSVGNSFDISIKAYELETLELPSVFEPISGVYLGALFNNSDDLSAALIFDATNQNEEIDKYEAINRFSTNLDSAYRILKTITSTKITFISNTNTGKKVTLIFEKRTAELPVVTPPEETPDSDFLEKEQQQEFSTITQESSVLVPWTITSARFGDTDLTLRFSKTGFIFKAESNSQNIEIYEADAFEFDEIRPSTTGTNEFLELPESDDFVFQMNIANSNLGLEKFEKLNDFGTNFKVLKDISNTKFTLLGNDQNGERATLVFEKAKTTRISFLELSDQEDLEDVLNESEVFNPFRLVTLQVGEQSLAEELFFNTTFFFDGRDNSNESILTAIDRSTDVTMDLPPVTINGTFKYAKDLQNENLRVFIDIEADTKELEKFQILNSLEGELGYLVKSNFTEDRVILYKVDINNVLYVLVFEKN